MLSGLIRMPRVSIPARRIVPVSRWPKVSSPTLARNAVFFPYALSAARKLPRAARVGGKRGEPLSSLCALRKINKQFAQRDHIIHNLFLLSFKKRTSDCSNGNISVQDCMDVAAFCICPGRDS